MPRGKVVSVPTVDDGTLKPAGVKKPKNRLRVDSDRQPISGMLEVTTEDWEYAGKGDTIMYMYATMPVKGATYDCDEYYIAGSPVAELRKYIS